MHIGITFIKYLNPNIVLPHKCKTLDSQIWHHKSIIHNSYLTKIGYWAWNSCLAIQHSSHWAIQADLLLSYSDALKCSVKIEKTETIFPYNCLLFICIFVDTVKRKTLVLDLDETLIHSHHDGVIRQTVKPGTPPDFVLKVRRNCTLASLSWYKVIFTPPN